MNAAQIDRELQDEFKRFYFDKDERFVEDKKKYLIKEIVKARKATERTSVARGNLDAYASRARITTANARHHTAAEHLWRCESELAYASSIETMEKS